VLDEERDVLGPLAQRRDHHLDAVHAEEEVLAEAPGRDLALEVAVRRADEAEVGAALAVAPTR